MKKQIPFLLMAAFVFAFACTACGSSPQKEEVSQPVSETAAVETTAAETAAAETEPVLEPEQKTDKLVIYFSAGNTKDADAVSGATPRVDDTYGVQWFAEMIREYFDTDIAQIIPSVEYPLDYDSLADYAKQEADTEARPEFEKLEIDPTSYETVFIGYPIWWYRMPMIMETFFDTYDFSGITIIPFNTHEGSWDGGTYDMIREREPEANVLEGRPLTGNKAGSEEAVEVINEWMQGLNLK